MAFAILNTYTGSYQSSGRDMATVNNMVTYPTQEDAEFAVLILTLQYPATEGHWKIERIR